MTTQSAPFRRSTPIERNDGTIPDTERMVERKSLKAIASAVLQRNAMRNDGGTARNDMDESFRINQSFHRSTVWERNDGTVEGDPDVWGAYTPYCPPRPITEWLAMIAELDRLIDRYCTQAGLSDEDRAHIFDARYRQPLASIPEAIAYFQHALSGWAVPGKT